MASDAEATVARAVDSMLDSGTRWLLRREIEKLPRLLPSGEPIAILAQGRLEGGTGLIVVTDRRLMFVEQGITHRRVEDLPFADVTSVEADMNVVTSELSFSSRDAQTRIGRVYPKARTMEIADYVRDRTSLPGATAHRLGRQPARD